MQRTVCAAVVCLLLSIANTASAQLVLCSRPSGGNIKLRIFACKPREFPVDPTLIGLQGPAGPQGESIVGPQGPQGEQGPPTSHGAGSIAFIAAYDHNVFVLDTDGVVWLADVDASGPNWKIANGWNPPVPVSDIVTWQLQGFVDVTGDFWRVDANNNYQWTNLGPVPQP